MADAGARPRMLYIDNIRWTLIVLVIVVHANVIYGPVGDFFGYKDRAAAGDGSDALFTLISVLIQAFFMGLFFMIAGYFVPGSHERKGSKGFVKERFMRLIVPALVFMFVLAPIIQYEIYFNDRSVAWFLQHYLLDVPNWDSGPMWFTIALFLFSGAYLLFYKSGIWTSSAGPLTRSRVLLLMVLVTAGSILVRIPFPMGTDVFNMQLSFFTQYIALFIVGILAFRNDWFSSLTKKDGRFWAMVALLSIFVLLIPDMILGGALDGNFDVYDGGLQWQAAVLSLWEQVFGISVCIFLLVWFRERLNHQSRLQKKLADNAFSVYLFHPLVVLGIAALLVDSGLPSIVKFAVVVVASVTIMFTLSEIIIRRVPGLRRIL